MEMELRDEKEAHKVGMYVQGVQLVIAVKMRTVIKLFMPRIGLVQIREKSQQFYWLKYKVDI